MLEVGTQQWAEALRDMANGLPLLRDLSAGFSASIGLGFLEDGARPARRCVVRIEAGVVVAADEVAEHDFNKADVRLTSDCTVWQTVLQGAVEPMHAIMVRHMFMEGDKILLLRGLPSAKALIEAARGLEADFTSAR